MTRWLLVGALGAEVLPLLARIERLRVLGPRLAEGRLGEAQVALLRCGVGPEAAERRTRQALATWEADRVVSLGTCGALVDELRIGQVLTADRLLEDTRPIRELSPLPGLEAWACSTVSVPVRTPEVRDMLAGVGAGICEMEAAGVARAAGSRSMGVIKVVSDAAGAHPDPALTTGRRLGIARFKLRALRLSRGALVDEVCRVVGG